jgi:predicted PurR-regulated permease PerM
MTNSTVDAPVRQAVEIAVILFLIACIVTWCIQILRPFVSFLVWGAILAIAIYNPFLKLRAKVGGRNGLAVAIVTIIGLAIIIVPAWMFTESLIEGSAKFTGEATSDAFHIQPPSENVKEWPIVGERLFSAWSSAASDLGNFLSRHQEQVRELGRNILGKIVGTGLGILQFVLSMLVAALFLANAEASVAGVRRFTSRLWQDRSEEMHQLAISTIRSVAVGVLGIAFIQAVLGGVGLLAAGVPAAGLWALLVLMVAIAQLPPILILGPICVYVFSHESTTVAVAFTAWSIMVSFADMALKPLFLGRGVEAPMPVILLGAIGGMITSGIVGLFIGAVILTLGYTLFMGWISMGEEEGQADSGSSDVADPTIPESS